MNGSGMPLVGNSPKTTPMLSIAWLTIIVVTPAAKKKPNESGALVAARNPYSLQKIDSFGVFANKPVNIFPRTARHQTTDNDVYQRIPRN